MSNWVVDNDRVRSFDGKRLLIEGRGVFKMKISETNSNGDKNPGFVMVLIEPYDLDAAMSCR